MNIEKEIIEISIDDIIPNRFQPREKFDDGDLNELSQSIREHGIINPIIVRKIGEKYEIVAGERRHKASIIAGMNTIPAIIAKVDDYESAEIALIENIQRKDLTPIEEAKTYLTILKMGDLTQEQLAQRMGKKQPTVANKLRLLELEQDVQHALVDGKISERHARSLLSVKDREIQKKLLEDIINKRMTVRETDLEIKKILGNDYIKDNEKEGKESFEIISEHDQKPLSSNNNIMGVDEIEKIKQQAADIKQTKPAPDINNLLKSKASDMEDDVAKNERMVHNKFVDLYNTSTNQISNNSFEVNNLEKTSKKEDIIPVNNDTYVIKDLRTVINTIRQCINTIEKCGFSIDAEEFDFEQMYQVIIKINKK